MNRLIETISKYIEARIELIKVDLQQGVASALVSVVQIGITLILGLFILTFVVVGLANVFNDLTDSPFWGWFIMAGFFLLILAAVQASKAAIQNKMEKVTGNMFKPAPVDAPNEVGATAQEVVDNNESLGMPSTRTEDLSRTSIPLENASSPSSHVHFKNDSFNK